MRYTSGICSACGNERLLVNKSKKLCLGCTKKAAIARFALRRKDRIRRGEEIDPFKLDIFYQQYWNRHPVRYCVECGIKLKKYHKWHIHHLIPKRRFKEYADDIVFADSNCVYVCLSCHSQAETDPQKTQAIWERTKVALQQFRSCNSVVPINRGDREEDASSTDNNGRPDDTRS